MWTAQRRGQQELHHHSFNPPERGPRGGRGASAHGWWSLPSPQSTADKQEGPSLPGPGSWEEKGWKKAGATKAFLPFPHP